MTAMILPGIVQLPFGLGHLVSAQWLAIGGLSGQLPRRNVEMFARKGLFSSIGRAGAVATVVAVGPAGRRPAGALAGSAASGKGGPAPAGARDAAPINPRR